MTEPLPYLTREIPGTGGRIRERPEDFLVEEEPLYETCGEGEHLYVLVEKRGIDTPELVDLLAGHFGVRRSAVGVAGRKDRIAVARQHISIHLPGAERPDPGMLDHECARILWADRHTNKLRMGHLAGNRFDIRIRGVAISALQGARAVLERLARVGVPNAFGPQRFGAKRDNHTIGASLIRGELRRRMPTEKRRFYLNAAQSAVFNTVLAERIRTGTLAELRPGDVAVLGDGGSIFPVEQVDADLAGRASRFELSPTGPMWGPKMMRAGGETAEAERRALEALGLSVETVSSGPHTALMPGERRSLRIRLVDPDIEGGADAHGAYIRVAFGLSRGGYATAVLREIMKTSDDAL